MEMLGAKVVPVTSGSKTLKDAVNEAIRDWVTNVESTYYIIGSAVGPHPYPYIVREFQSIIGIESRKQIIEKTGSLPNYVLACVGGGSNAIGQALLAKRIGKKRIIAETGAGQHGVATATACSMLNLECIVYMV